jgi:membrane protein YdbS with pleckstrin-like domain
LNASSVPTTQANGDTTVLPVDAQKLESYVYWAHFWLSLFLSAVSFGMLLPIWIVWVAGLGRWYSREFVKFYSVGLQAKRLRINHGVVFQKRKAIPLDRITDVLIRQGFLERRMGICQVRIHTAGTGMHGSFEGMVLAIPESQGEVVQDQIIAARDRYSERSVS